MQFWFILVLIRILLFHSCLVALNVLLCSCVTSAKRGFETKTRDCNLTVFTAAPLGIIQHFNYDPFKNEAWKGTAAVAATALLAWGGDTQPLIQVHDECLTWSKPQKSIFVLECLLISLGFTHLHFCLYHTWPVNVGWAAALTRVTFLWETQKTQQNLHILLLFKTLWFLNLQFSNRLIASDILITFLAIDKLPEERMCFGLDWGPGRS